MSLRTRCERDQGVCPRDATVERVSMEATPEAKLMECEEGRRLQQRPEQCPRCGCTYLYRHTWAHRCTNCYVLVPMGLTVVRRADWEKQKAALQPLAEIAELIQDRERLSDWLDAVSRGGTLDQVGRELHGLLLEARRVLKELERG